MIGFWFLVSSFWFWFEVQGSGFWFGFRFRVSGLISEP